MWNEFTWNQIVAPSLGVQFRGQGRIEEGISNADYREIETALSWRYSPRWTFAAAYENDQRFGEDEDVVHMPSLNATLMIPLRDWLLSNRFRMEFPVSQTGEDPWRAVYNNQTTLETKWKLGSRELRPFLSDQVRYSIQDGAFAENQLSVGVGIPVASHWTAQLFWMRLDERTVEGWEWHPVLGVQIASQF